MRIRNSILLTLILGACGQPSELSVERTSEEFCSCFNSQTIGTVDEKLSPCLQKIADKKNKEWNDSGLNDPDSIINRFYKLKIDLLLQMTRTCDNYFIAVNDLYDNGYPKDTTELNRNAIIELSTRIKKETNMDSVKSMLHKKTYRLIQAREFDLALQSIDSIKSLDDVDYGANLASAYIFNQKGLHDQAVTEIEKAIEISRIENLKLYAEIARQKKRRSQK